MKQQIINIGIMAHIDAGKTSLTESLLYTTGVKEQKGSVDQKSTSTDSLALEQERGITIKASTISTEWQGSKINIIDTPGHMDFIGEVERSFAVLDGAILVVSANEGVQEQTRVIYRKLQEKGIPTLIFINKIDIPHSDIQGTIQEIKQLLKKPTICLSDQSRAFQGISEEVANQLLDNDEYLAEKFLLGEEISQRDYLEQLKKKTQLGEVLPLFLGSAMKEIGIKALLTGIVKLIPVIGEGEPDELSAFIYKIERLGNKRRLYVRVFTGELSYRQIVNCLATGVSCQLNHLYGLVRGEVVPVKSILSGDIAVIETTASLKIGDWFGQARRVGIDESLVPSLKSRVILTGNQSRGEVLDALNQLMEEDPLIRVAINSDNQEISLMLFGEVQKEVVVSSLLERFNLVIDFGETAIIYKERMKKTVENRVGMVFKPNPYWATIQLKLEPLPIGSGVEMQSEVSLGYLKRSFQSALFEGLEVGLKNGNYGWEVTDIRITVTDAKYESSMSTPADFRQLAPYVLWQGLSLSETELLMPIVTFELYISQAYTSKVLSELQKLKAIIHQITIEDNENCVTGNLTQEASNYLQMNFTEWTNGKGLVVITPTGYLPIEGIIQNQDKELNSLRELFNR